MSTCVGVSCPRAFKRAATHVAFARSPNRRRTADRFTKKKAMLSHSEAARFVLVAPACLQF